MKHKKKKLLLSLFLLSATTQVFSMGSKLPAKSNLMQTVSSSIMIPKTSSQVTNPVNITAGDLSNLIGLFPITLRSVPALINLLPTLMNFLPSIRSAISIPMAPKSIASVPKVVAPVVSIPKVSAPVASAPIILPPKNPPIQSGNTEANAYVDHIKLLAENSTCANYSWKNRGTPPIGYIKGMALSYARSLCRLKTSSVLSSIMSASNTSNSAKDAISLYESNFKSLPILIGASGEGPLRALYVLGMGLGMRESSGETCEGWDKSAGSNRSSNAAEAGVFQTSYDSIGSSPELSKLYAEYKASPERCLLDVFKEGASCGASSILGTGAGAEFQAFNKSCPAFATEYAMTMLRVQRSHYGPINRKEAEVVPACNQLLLSIQDYINSDSYSCQDLQ
jgi:hypothetical protein